MKRKHLLLALGFTAISCNASKSTAPTTVPSPDPEPMYYSINIPDLETAAHLTRLGTQFIPPLEAQRTWDYTAAYGGSPNVYFGDTAPGCGQYMHTGIVIAPRSVADLETFTAADWPGIGLQQGRTYQWAGQFEYSVPAPAGSYVPGTCK